MFKKRSLLILSLFLLSLLTVLPIIPMAEAPSPASLDNPIEDGNVYFNGATYTRQKTQGLIAAGLATVYYRGYFEWNTSSIPNTATITSVVFKYHGNAHNIDCHIHAITAKPSTATDAGLYADIADGTVYADPAGFPVVGANQAVDLGATARSDLQALLTSDWFAIGFQSDNEGTSAISNVFAEEGGGAAPKPTLYVEYIPDNIPTNDACDSTTTFNLNINGWVNMTVSDADLVADLKTVDIQVNTTGDAQTFTLRWTQATGLFSEVSDTSNVCTLGSSIRENIDADTDKIAFQFKFTGGAAGLCDVKATTTDDADAVDTDTYASEFTLGTAPTITSSIITDMDDADNLYTMKDYYTFQTEITDLDGATNIWNVSVRGSQGADVRWQVNATELNSTAVYTLVTGNSTTDLNSAACNFTENGNIGTLTLKLLFYWNSTNEDDCELAVWAADVDNHTVGWTTVHSDYFDVINRLTTTNFTPSTTGVDINTSIAVSGFVRYSNTTTGDVSSSSYPPDGQFTSVSIIDDLNATVATDTAIVDGYFYVIFNSAGTLKTTYYHAYLDMVDPYIDGDAPDGDIFYVTTGATFPAIDFLANAFAFFGLVAAIAGTVYPTLLAFTAWFTAAAATLVSLIFTIMTAISFIVGFVIDWFTRMVNFFISLFTIIGSIFDGTYTGGLSNLWVVFNVSAWIDFIPVLVFMLWFGNLSKRVMNSGRSSIEIIVGDVQIVMYIVGEVWSWSYTVFTFVLNTIGQLASRF